VVGRGGCGEKSWVEVNGGNVGAVGAVLRQLNRENILEI